MSGPVIGVFDSGFGGLSVLHELQLALPTAHFIYVADSGHCPYGGKSAEEITRRAVTITDFLLSQGAERIVVACNTATIAAIETLRHQYAVPFIGMEPAIKPAAALTQTGVVGVLATGAALAGAKLHRLIERHAAGVRVLTQPCPGLVECVESGALDTPETTRLIECYTAPLLAERADVLVLGCTHYPFLRAAIQAAAGPKVQLLDTGAAVARRVLSLLLPDEIGTAPGSTRFFTSGDLPLGSGVASQLWGRPVALLRMP
jgi:glutamate racemase